MKIKNNNYVHTKNDVNKKYQQNILRHLNENNPTICTS